MNPRDPQMGRAWLIIRKDVREALRSKSTYIYILPMLLMSSFYFSSFFNLQKSLEREHATEAVVSLAVHAFLNGLASMLPMLYCLFACNLTIASLFTEKSKRSLESLMATPVSIRAIWLGKSLAATITGGVVGLAAALCAYLIIALGEVRPRIHETVAPSWTAVVTAVVLVPLVLFTVTLLVNYIQLVAASPRVGPLVNTGLLLVVWGGLFLASYLLPRRGTTIDYYPLIFLGLIALLGMVAYGVSRGLTKERIVLSSKG